jgi:CMP/dCMP kinase
MANGLLIVIDGPAGAGKSTVARRLAERYGLPMLDTGAIYRALALIARERAVAWNDEAGLAELASEMGAEFAGGAGDAASAPAEPPIRFVAVPGAPQRVLLGGRDVTDAIRTPEISDGASQVSAHPAVRRGLLGIQRQLGARGCVAEGRDLGTVVFPGAPYKFFLTADDLVRAARRQHELPPGLPLEQVLRDLKSRDERDQKRAAAPLVQAPDAVRVDSTGLDLDEVVSAIMAEIDGRRRAG